MNKQELGLNIICQVGLVVRDITKSVQAYSQVFGMSEPPVIITDTYDVAKTMYKGEPTNAQAKLAFFQMGQVSLELIEPMGGPSTWQEFLDEKGEGVHHIAFEIQGTDGVTAFLEGKGIRMVQQGVYPGGMYTYVDSAPAFGVILELLENFDSESQE
ncbi:MAG: VOC family protein [Chloroflexi bacterium]|nr:VOC family protein [Chloroflexota bacterium]